MAKTPYTRDKSITGSFRYRNSTVGWSNPTPSTTHNHVLKRDLSGWRDPEWRKKVADQVNATTNLIANYSRVEVKRSRCTVIRASGCAGDPNRYESTSIGDHAVTHDNGSWLEPSGYTATLGSVDSRANAAAFRAIRNAQTKLQGLVALGELRETFRMIRHPAKSLFDKNDGFLRKVNKARRRDSKGWLKTAGELWLEGAFGWRPLIADMKDATKALNELVNGTKHSVHFSVGATGNKLISETGVYDHSPVTGQFYDSNKIDIETRTLRYRGVVANRVAGPTWADPGLFGFEPSQFIPSAWELLPWSFLIDYFSNIGNILESTFTSTTGLAWSNATLIQRKKRTRVIKWNIDKMRNQFGCPNLLFIEKVEPGWYTHEVKTVTRSPGSFPSIPSLYFELPGSDTQLFNCAALFALAFETHPQRTYHPKTGRQYIF